MGQKEDRADGQPEPSSNGHSTSFIVMIAQLHMIYICMVSDIFAIASCVLCLKEERVVSVK